MDIKVKIPLKCSKCGGAKYVDEPYLISDTWFVDLVCLNCGDTKSTEKESFKKLLGKLQGR